MSDITLREKKKKKKKIDAIVAEYSRREDLPLWKRIELLDRAIGEELGK